MRLKRLLFVIHRDTVLKSVSFWTDKWGENSLLVVLSVFIGIAGALLAAVLHKLVSCLEKVGNTLAASENAVWYWLLLILPFVGIGASFLVQRFLGGPRYAKSLSPLILALNRKKHNIPVSEMFTHMLSSGLSVGLGGSAGLEAPSVLTGAALGANTASFFHVDRRRRSLLLGCGAAAAIAAIFDSPVAAVLFAAEVLLPEFSVSALIPMLMSSAVATICHRVLVGESTIFYAINAPWRTNAIPAYFLCGVLCALVGVYVVKMAYYLSDKLKHRFRNKWVRLLFSGSLLCLLLAVFPLLRGQGYAFIGALFHGDMESIRNSAPLLKMLDFLSPPVLLVILIAAGIFIKVIASVLTVDGGGDGGIFAPSMFIGAFTGFAFARLVNLTGLIELQEYNFVAVGMCGVFTAVMRAPMTGVFLIAEVTGGYLLLVPLMIVSSVSFFTARFFEPNSIYRKALAESHLLHNNRDEALLQRLPVRLNLSRNYHVLKAEQPLSELSKLISRTSEEIFPVLDNSGHLLGVVHLEKILTVMLDPQVHSLLVVMDLMETPCGVVTPDDDLAGAMRNFEKFNLKYLPVCDQQGMFHGFVSKAAIFVKYRRMVREADDF